MEHKRAGAAFEALVAAEIGPLHRPGGPRANVIMAAGAKR